MKLNKKIFRIVIVSIFINIFFTALIANANESDIDWLKLNLTENQKAKIEAIDKTWKTSTNQRYQRLKRNKADLKKAILSHKTSHQDIRTIYVQIIHDECVLKDKAIECFLKKRSLLDTKQLQSLNKS